METQLGVELFTRSRMGMPLTETGRVLAERVPVVLEDWDIALRETRGASSRASRVLRVGFVASAANESTQEIIGSFARRRPGWRVEVLITEPRWVGIPTTHPLAELAEIPFRQLWDEPFVATPTESGWWRDYRLATDERDGCPVKIGAIANNPDEWLSAIANGYGVSLTPEATARFYQRPGVTYRPVTGVSPSQVGVAWAPTSDNDAVIDDFVRACLRHRAPTTVEPDTRAPMREVGAD